MPVSPSHRPFFPAGANSASRARRNTRSLAIFVRRNIKSKEIFMTSKEKAELLFKQERLSGDPSSIPEYEQRARVEPAPCRLMCGVCVGQRRLTRIVPKTRRCSRSCQVEVCRALCSFRHLWFDAPELKAMSADRRFDCIAGKIVRRCALGSDRTNLPPGTKLIRQFAARRVSGERS
jgi:hypothetical protein